MKIITPAIGEPITLAMARKQCRVDAEGSPPAHEDDDLIEVFIAAAREWCEAYTGRIFSPTVVEVAFASFPAGAMTLQSGPVLAVESIAYTDADGNAATVDPLTYGIDDDATAIVLNDGELWPSAIGTVTVRYTVGYSLDDDSPLLAPLPKSIKTAMLLIIGHLYRNREASVERALTTIPMGVTFFLGPFKLRKGFA